MTVNRTATQAGKNYERQLLTYLRDDGLEVERLRLSGAEDEGDLWIRLSTGPVVIEAKREKGFNLGGWLREAEDEARHFADHRRMALPPPFVVVHHARNKSISKSYVTTTLEQWLGMIR